MSMSPFQELWTYAHIQRGKQIQNKEIFDYVKLVCTFINPTAAAKVFTEGEKSESDGFFDDLKALNPKFNPDDYKKDFEALDEAQEG